MIVHEALLEKRGVRQLGNGLLARVISNPVPSDEMLVHRRVTYPQQ